MIKVGITGQAGFIGGHLFNTLKLHPEKFTCIPFEDCFFKDNVKIKAFVSHCDVIIHLAAMNRHNDPNILYKINLELTQKLISACEVTGSSPHIIFSSSTQEERDNLYGKSKKECRQHLETWAKKHNSKFTGLIIPNVFGPFGNPYYNSVIATFCHQLTHNETPKIEVDGEIKLIFVSELVSKIINHIELMQRDIDRKNAINIVSINHTATIKVSRLLENLVSYKTYYFEKGIIPDLDDSFSLNLFNTFVCYIDHKKFFPFPLKLNSDNRGSFVEIIKLNSGGQVSFSTTVSGITRGDHFHTRKAERFAVIKGKARIEIRRIGTDEIISFDLDGRTPSFVDMPIWFTHNITNIGKDELYTMFWINEHFNNDDPDTFFEKVL